MTGEELLKLLHSDTSGLMYMSEAEFPLSPFLWEQQQVGAPSITPEVLREWRKIPDSETVQEVPFADFFAPAVTEQEWFEPEDHRLAERFRQLMQVLQTHLTDLKVFKVGRVRKVVYVVGRTTDGHFAGFSTLVVET
ncbi:MAG: nuclease A inhibitor family protein [Chloroherpetonaceae bacterium]|nr:nuclease A inhibitor family protein [Chthonomonadaceae bacterium]MDW8206503.1 nuclease A inhibitor family protein [Chloroherpetonaceae bacterium]